MIKEIGETPRAIVVSSNVADTVSPFSRAVRPPTARTLASLRWLAIAGQTGALVVATQVFDVAAPLGACFLAIAAAALYNLSASLPVGRPRRLSDARALAMLAFDLAQISVLIYLTGGLANPFALFLLAPVSVAAATLSLRSALALGFLSIGAVTILSQYSLPIQLADGSLLSPPALWLAGFWSAIVVGVATQAIYARQIAREALDMAAALGATQSALERERRATAIGALAAAAAHELGTPLATIKLVASELASDLKARAGLEDRDALAEDARLIVEQARRCSDILRQLSSVRSPETMHLKKAPLSTVVAEAAEPHQLRRCELLFRLNGAPFEPDDAPSGQPLIDRRPEIIHGLRNFVQNAVDFAAGTVWVDITTTEAEVAVRIGDDGAGFSADILDKLGEPFSTTRGKAASDAAPGEYLGMGLGVFIAITLLEQTGARVSFANASRPRRTAPAVEEPIGALVTVTWPRAILTA